MTVITIHEFNPETDVPFVIPWIDTGGKVQPLHWYKPSTPPLLATEERSPGDIERTVEHVLGDLKGRAIGKVTAERIRDAAADRVKQVESDQSFHRAIKGGS